MNGVEAYPGFAPEHDAPIPYMQRIRDYYQGLGYGAPYRWAHYAEVPFQPLQRPLTECRVALITTAVPYQPGKGDQGPGAPYNAAAKFYSVYSEGCRRRSRSADLPCRDRSGPHQRRGQQHLVPFAGTAPLRGDRQDRRGRTTLPWRADQPQPSHDDRAGLP